MQICNNCLCGQVEMKVDYKVRDQVFESIRLQQKHLHVGDMLLVRVSVGIRARGMISGILAG